MTNQPENLGFPYQPGAPPVQDETLPAEEPTEDQAEDSPQRKRGRPRKSQ